ncbi:hypothetical protein ACFPZ0_00170 [Streptomonospora nanhaiensis]|uniref:Nitroreductase domain-containing protein n=1 Tax=Streptomonospora nanhaiensis TaxID=1323731 RepID=A0A853BI78_9ACTN|nr:hypothetical protein [Streptomonospora nanhaiensis]MBV2364167.1 hypothetical protein [Streptomonospora nanhaiensis]MBX9386713.1 hypothetical protein [Streptomonospora nanhaiensis]NYI95119.1 hypothetical protein [Streptomonospora nanhaiensis]
MFSTDHPPGRARRAPRPTKPPRLPAVLARAFAADPPGPAAPPGPRVNPWHRVGAVPVAVCGRERDLLTGLWSGEGFHRLPDGTLTGVRRRPVPSAGGAYPVQTHLVVGTAGGTLEAGRYVYDHEHDTLLRRDDRAERAVGRRTDPAGHPPAGTHVVLTVQPGRSFGRYRHRAWPLWIADTAYALAAVEFLVRAEPARVLLGPSAALRGLLGVPRAAEHERWLAQGLAPEIPLAAVELPAAWAPDPGRRAALAGRRSPAISEFTRAARHRPRAAGAERAAAACGQAWILGAHRLETWSVATAAPAAAVAGVLWRAHRAAAALCYAGAASGRWRCRPVSGFTATRGRWTVHALAMLPGGPGADGEAAP